MRIPLLIITLFFSLSTSAQVTLDLPTCLQRGVTNNLGVKTSQNALSIAEINLIQARFDFLPGVAGQMRYNQSIGLAVDNFSQQIANSPRTVNPGIGADLVLFNGFAKWNTLNASKLDISAARYTMEDLRNDIRLTIAGAYIQAIFTQENLEITKDRIELLTKQLERTENLFEAGTLTKGDVLALKAQLAGERVNLTTGNNLYKQNLLNLILAMNEDPEQDYQLVKPALSDLLMVKPTESTASIFEAAREFNPGLKGIRAQIKAQEYRIKATQGLLYPTLTMSYGLGSFYSSNARPLIGFTNDPDLGIRPLYGPTPSLFSQLDQNISQSLALSMNIPIFQNYRIRQSIRVSELNLENTRINYESEENLLYQAVARARQDVDAAYAVYEATLDKIEAATLNFDFAQVRYDAGVTDFTTFMEALNNKTQSETELLQAKYDFVMKTKILELYRGQKIEF